MSETINSEEKKSFDLSKPVKVIAVTTAFAGIGVLGAIAAVTAAAVAEVVLPAALCLKAAGITGGAIGLAMGLGKKKQENKK